MAFKYKFQHFIDVSTAVGSMQIIQISAGGRSVLERCQHLVGAYKYMKLGKISIKCVATPSIPADPLGLSYADDDPLTVDPRDVMNPGLIRITNGEDIKTNIAGISEDAQRGMYEAMMLDPKWFKWNVAQGCKRTAYPKFWSVASAHQNVLPGTVVNVPYKNGSSVAVNHTTMYQSGSDAALDHLTAGSSQRGLFQTGHKERMGFLPTDAFEVWVSGNPQSMVVSPPTIQCITMVLPPMRKTKYFFRIYITEEVWFAGLKSIAPYVSGTTGKFFRQGIDNFAYGGWYRADPEVGQSVSTTTMTGAGFNDGGVL